MTFFTKERIIGQFRKNLIFTKKRLMKNILLFLIILSFNTADTYSQCYIKRNMSADEAAAMKSARLNNAISNLSTPATAKDYTPGIITAGNCDSIVSTFTSNNGLSGVMWDVEAVTNITINGMYSNISQNATFELYYKTGTYVGFANNSAAWTLLGSTALTFVANDDPVYIDIPMSINVQAGNRIAFYLTNNNASGFGGMRYTNGVGSGTLYTNNADLEIYEGTGITYPFDNLYADRVWNGALLYCPLVTGIDEASSAAVKITPNPVIDYADFSFGDHIASSLKIFNITGEEVFAANEISSSHFRFNRNNLKSGIYFYEVNSKEKLISKGKLVIQ